MEDGMKVLVGVLGIGALAYMLNNSESSSFNSFGTPKLDGSGGGVRANYNRGGCNGCV